MPQLFELIDNKLEVHDSILWNRANEKEFEEILKDMISRYDDIHVDLTRCFYINSSYISILVCYHYFALMRDARLTIRISSSHRRHFYLSNEMTAMNLEIVPSVETEVPAAAPHFHES